MAVKKTKAKKVAKPKTTAKKKTVAKSKAVKPKAKTKVTKKVTAKKKKTARAAVKKKIVRKSAVKPKAKKKITAKAVATAKTIAEPKKSVGSKTKSTVEKSAQKNETPQFPTLKPSIPSFRKPSTHLVERRRPMKPRPVRSTHFSFMKAPGTDHEFEVGDNVEVFCDHDKSKERIRGWLKGIVVQVDNKMVAVQFRTNVYLTDGWMVPDRILWYPLTSEHIRSLPGKKKASKKEFLPDF